VPPPTPDPGGFEGVLNRAVSHRRLELRIRPALLVAELSDATYHVVTDNADARRRNDAILGQIRQGGDH
jgi:hypothetical protein